MSLREKLSDDLKQAMRQQDEARKRLINQVVRELLAA